MAQKDTLPRREARVHIAFWLADYAAGRLEPASDHRVETHLVTCEPCFAAYVAMLLRRDLRHDHCQ
jgi:hypothetical protein